MNFLRQDLGSVLHSQLLKLLTLPRGAFASVQMRDVPSVAVQFAGSRDEPNLWFDLPAVWLTPIQLPMMRELADQYGVEYVDPDDEGLPPVFVRDFHGDIELAVALTGDVFSGVYEVCARAAMVMEFEVTTLPLPEVVVA